MSKPSGQRNVLRECDPIPDKRQAQLTSGVIIPNNTVPTVFRQPPAWPGKSVMETPMIGIQRKSSRSDCRTPLAISDKLFHG
jgi:hypothetical protein